MQVEPEVPLPSYQEANADTQAVDGGVLDDAPPPYRLTYEENQLDPNLIPIPNYGHPPPSNYRPPVHNTTQNVIIHLPNSNNRHRRASSCDSVDTAYEGEATVLSGAKSAPKTSCYLVLTDGNFLAATFRALRRANGSIGRGPHRIFPFLGTLGNCLSTFVTLFTALYSVVLPLLVTFAHYISQSYYGSVQMLPNIIMWTAVIIDFAFFIYYVIALEIHKINVQRFKRCPYIIKIDKSHFILRGEANVYREVTRDAMINHASNSEARSLLYNSFSPGQKAWAMYYCVTLEKRYIRGVTRKLRVMCFLHILSIVLYIFWGVAWGQLYIP